MRILVTGANGYLGAHITKCLSENNNEVIALTRNKHKSDFPFSGNLEVVNGEITSKEVIDNLVEKFEFDAIVQLVSMDHKESNRCAREVSKVNVLPTWELLEGFKNKGLKKFIYFSTAQVYGRTGPIKINENTPCEPLNQYALTHLMCEDVVSYYNRTSEINCLNIRLSNSYGAPIFKENNCWWLVVNDLCKSAVYDEKITLLSDGSPQRDFIHIRDVALSVKNLLDTGFSKDLETLNLCSGETKTILELAFVVKDQFEKRFDKKIDVITPNGVVTEIKKSCERFNFIPSLRDEMGITLSTSLEDGINDLFDKLSEQ